MHTHMCRSIRVHVIVDASLVRKTPDGDMMRVPAFFRSNVQDVDTVSDLSTNK